MHVQGFHAIFWSYFVLSELNIAFADSLQGRRSAKQQSHVRSWEVIRRAASQQEESELQNEPKRKNNNGIQVPWRHFRHIFLSCGCGGGGSPFALFLSLSLFFLFCSFPPYVLSSPPCSFHFLFFFLATLLLSLTAPVNLMSALPGSPQRCETDLSAGKCESGRKDRGERGAGK